jgi:hypothetical protein
MTGSAYKYILVLACTWVMGVRQVFVLLQQRNVEKYILHSLAEPHWQIDQLELLFQTAMFFFCCNLANSLIYVEKMYDAP